MRGITKDLWVQLLHFIRQFNQHGAAGGIEQHDSTSGAWPVLIDEFVDNVRDGKEKKKAGSAMVVDS